MLDILFFTHHNFVGSALCAYLTVIEETYGNCFQPLPNLVNLD